MPFQVYNSIGAASKIIVVTQNTLILQSIPAVKLFVHDWYYIR
jgi:hypothetical protein